MKQGFFADAMDRRLQTEEASLYLRSAMQSLTPIERYAVYSYISGTKDGAAGKLAGVGSLSPGAHACLKELVRTLSRHGQNSRPKQEAIARRMGCGERSVKRYMAELRELGLVDVKRSRRAPALYFVQNHFVAEMFGTSKIRAVTANGMWAARQRALRKLKEHLARMGFEETGQLIEA